MHEMSIAVALVDRLTRLAAEQHAVRIVDVEVECGILQQIVPDALLLAFEAASADTPAAGAKLKIVEEGLAAHCRNCGQHFEASLDDYRCPQCGRADAELIAGQDVVLRTVVCETENEAAT